MARLNVNQEKFCIEYARCGNATEAYQKAGYKVTSEKVAGVNATRLLGNARVQQRLEELQKEMAKPKIMDAEERQELLTQMINEAMETGNHNVACKAMEILNKMQGSYINKVELGGTDGGPLQFAWTGDGKE